MTPSPLLSYQEEDALRRILAHHHVSPDRPLVNALAALIQWVRQSEQAKARFATSSPGTPPDLLSLLGQLGIYGGEAIGPSPTGVS